MSIVCSLDKVIELNNINKKFWNKARYLAHLISLSNIKQYTSISINILI